MRLASIDQLRPGMALAEDVYLETKSGERLLMNRGAVLDPSAIGALQRNGIQYVHITDRSAIAGMQGELVRFPSRYQVPKKKPLLEPAFRSEAVSTIEEAFKSLSLAGGNLHAASVRVIKQVDAVVEHLVDVIASDKNTVININDVKSYDEYTYHHSLSVAMLSIAIAQRIGFDQRRLSEMGRCAILHDIGKTAVPIELIHKPTRLTAEEFALMKTHSSEGYRYLAAGGLVGEAILNGVLYHHEKVDGTGYPQRLKYRDIPLYSRIIAVADVYDALTSNRPYRDPMCPSEAVEYIMGGVGTAFDYDVVQAFLYKLELYPVGSIVMLSNRGAAIVINNEHQMRPIVRLADTGEMLDLFSDKRCRNIVIECYAPDDILKMV